MRLASTLALLTAVTAIPAQTPDRASVEIVQLSASETSFTVTATASPEDLAIRLQWVPERARVAPQTTALVDSPAQITVEGLPRGVSWVVRAQALSRSPEWVQATSAPVTFQTPDPLRHFRQSEPEIAGLIEEALFDTPTLSPDEVDSARDAIERVFRSRLLSELDTRISDLESQRVRILSTGVSPEMRSP